MEQFGVKTVVQLPHQSDRVPGPSAAMPESSLESGPKTRVRFLVFFMMFVAIVLNYMDRANFTVSSSAHRKAVHLDITQMGRISFIWGLAYFCAV